MKQEGESIDMRTDPIVEVLILVVACSLLLMLVYRAIQSDEPAHRFRFWELLLARDLNETGHKSWTAIVMGIVVLVALLFALVSRLLTLVNT